MGMMIACKLWATYVGRQHETKHVNLTVGNEYRVLDRKTACGETFVIVKDDAGVKAPLLSDQFHISQFCTE